MITQAAADSGTHLPRTPRWQHCLTQRRLVESIVFEGSWWESMSGIQELSQRTDVSVVGLSR